MRKILFLTAFPPSKKTAGQNFTRLLLEKLSEDYSIDLFYCEYKGVKADQSILCNRNIVVHKFNNSPYMKFLNALMMPFFHPFFTCRFNFYRLFFLKKKSKYDLIYLDFSQMFLYGLFFEGRIVMMAHDIIHQKYTRSRYISGFLKLLNLIFVKAIENKVFSVASQILVFSQKDRNYVKRIYNKDSDIVHFFIDKDILNIDYSDIQFGDYFCLYGAWGRQENQDMLLWMIENKIVDFGFDIKIIGTGIPEKYYEILSNRKNIDLLGFVDDPYKIISGAKAMLAPLTSGAGVKVKVVESLACGTPVLGTDVAFEGVDFSIKNALIKLEKEPSDIKIQLKLLLNIKIDEKENIRDSFLREYQHDMYMPHNIFRFY